jgi:hypothetical protein
MTASGVKGATRAGVTARNTVAEYYTPNLVNPGVIESNIIQEAGNFGDFGWADLLPGFATLSK